MKSYALLAALMALTLGCKKKRDTQQWQTKQLVEKNRVHNQLFAIEKEQGWQLLFDGESLDGWHLYNNADSTQFSAWQVKEGLLYCNATDERKIHGDLVTDAIYENYEFVFDWKIAIRGNSGVFINVQEQKEIPNTYSSGPEYQLLEPMHMDYSVPNKRPGTLWGFSPQLHEVAANPEGMWNTSTIKQKDGKIQFYLNGVLTVEEDFNSDDWKKRVKASGFASSPEFGAHTKGKIALQHWYFDVWFRNMKIRKM